MDSPNSNNDENKWIEDRIADLRAPLGWKPDSDRAFERVMQRQPAAASRSLRLLMAGATLAAIAMVVTMLPWHMLWTPKKSESPAVVQQPATAGQASPDPPKPEPTTTTPATTASQPVVPVKAQATPPQTDPPAIPRTKKLPRIIAGDVAPEPEPSVPLLAGVAAQPQGQQPAPPPSGVAEPILLSQVQPGYTPEAREARIQGTIELRCTVREDGTVKVDSILKALGYGLDEAATAAVEQWKFIPGKKDGKPVAVLTSILINFSLK